MTWNHRVIRHKAEGEWGEVWFGVHECFYEIGGDKIPTAWTLEPIGIVGDSITELIETLNHIIKAITTPTLEITEDGEHLQVWKDE